MKTLVAALMVVAMFVSVGFAFTGTISGTQVSINYQEPNTNELDYLGNTTTIDDLHHTTVYYQAAGSTTPVVGIVVPATVPDGNGIINTSIVVPVQNKRRLTYSVWATATDTSGNEGVACTPITVIVDKLAPAAPK